MSDNATRAAGSYAPACLAIFTIGSKTDECYGHGNYGTETRICREGAWGTGQFPPCFCSRTDAERYIASKGWQHDDKIVVELRLMPNVFCTTDVIDWGYQHGIDLTEKEAGQILEKVHHRIDAFYGLRWQNIEEEVRSFDEKRKTQV
jgi:hypothetical protein